MVLLKNDICNLPILFKIDSFHFLFGFIKDLFRGKKKKRADGSQTEANDPTELRSALEDLSEQDVLEESPDKAIEKDSLPGRKEDHNQ